MVSESSYNTRQERKREKRKIVEPDARGKNENGQRKNGRMEKLKNCVTLIPEVKTRQEGRKTEKTGRNLLS